MRDASGSSSATDHFPRMARNRGTKRPVRFMYSRYDCPNASSIIASSRGARTTIASIVTIIPLAMMNQLRAATPHPTITGRAKLYSG
jgi:hypothetical protein